MEKSLRVSAERSQRNTGGRGDFSCPSWWLSANTGVRGQHGHGLAGSPRGCLVAQGGREERTGDRGPFPHCWVAQRRAPQSAIKIFVWHGLGMQE